MLYNMKLKHKQITQIQYNDTDWMHDYTESSWHDVKIDTKCHLDDTNTMCKAISSR